MQEYLLGVFGKNTESDQFDTIIYDLDANKLDCIFDCQYSYEVKNAIIDLIEFRGDMAYFVDLPERLTYLNEILAHIGGCIIGSVTEKNKLRIATFDEVAQASPINYDIQGTKSITMSLEGQAQRNIYTHKENDDAGLEYTGEGIIYTNDDTLAIERKAFESKFKVPRNTIVRLFEVENSSEGNGAKWVGGSDYITGWDEDLAILKNTGQDFEQTISSYYTNFENIVSHPKEVNVIVRLNVLELMKFNFEKPAYIKQLGRKYLVKSIENESGDNYKLTLVQI
jgi:hypothetical protein